jgi:hypothetical protein
MLALVLLGTYAGGLAMRRIVLYAQAETISPDMPFTLESALHYRRAKMLYDRGQLPLVDEAIQYPEGIRIREIDAIASEPVQAFLARFFPEAIPFADRIRWIEAGWFCLSLPLLVLMMRAWTGSWLAGVITATLYAVSLASVLRTTGQEISRENFSFPWLIAAYGCAACYFKAVDPVRRWGWGLGAAMGIALALMSWDMMQYVIGVMALGVGLHVLIRGEHHDRRLLSLYALGVAAIFLTGLFHPYYRYHGLAFSPLMVWMTSIGAAAWFFAARGRRRARASAAPTDRLTLSAGASLANAPDAGRTVRGIINGPRLIPALILFGPLLVMLTIGMTGAYGSSYGHFAELLAAKIRFLNVKPSDPSLLTYYQRIMWVPSLHSATWALTKWLFPFSVALSCLVALVAWFDSFKRPDPLIHHWLLLFGLSLAAYVLFVRFHVFVALAASVWCGWAYGRVHRAGVGWRAAALMFAGWAVIAEGSHTLDQRHQMGRPNVYYDELKELAEWLREHVAPHPVLANMGVSAYIAAYGKCPIVIHPKFEDAAIRLRLHEYGDILFGADEERLRDWMDEHGVMYFVYSKGEFAAEKPEYQMRYFVNKMDPPETAPARRFEKEDDSLQFFTRLWGNRKYVVYQALSSVRELEAEALAAEANGALQAGRLVEAETLAVQALAIQRNQKTALQIMRHVGSLKEQGFPVLLDSVEP